MELHNYVCRYDVAFFQGLVNLINTHFAGCALIVVELTSPPGGVTAETPSDKPVSCTIFTARRPLEAFCSTIISSVAGFRCRALGRFARHCHFYFSCALCNIEVTFLYNVCACVCVLMRVPH